MVALLLLLAACQAKQAVKSNSAWGNDPLCNANGTPVDKGVPPEKCK